MGVRRRVFDRSESWTWLITGLLGKAAFAGTNLVVYVRNLALLRARPSGSPGGVEGVPSS